MPFIAKMGILNLSAKFT
jgi:hypothetical protein